MVYSYGNVRHVRKLLTFRWRGCTTPAYNPKTGIENPPEKKMHFVTFIKYNLVFAKATL